MRGSIKKILSKYCTYTNVSPKKVKKLWKECPQDKKEDFKTQIQHDIALFEQLEARKKERNERQVKEHRTGQVLLK